MLLEAWRAPRFPEVENWTEEGGALQAGAVGGLEKSAGHAMFGAKQGRAKQGNNSSVNKRGHLNTGILISPNTSVCSNSVGEQLNIALFSNSIGCPRKTGGRGKGGEQQLCLK